MRLKTPSLEFELETRGEGRPIILLHGLGLNHGIWQPVVDLYADQAYFITPDLRGQGKSSLGEADGSLEQQADDIAELMDALGLEKAVLAGHSMGGYLSLAFAERHPERLAGLVLVASNARADTPEKKAGRLKDAEAILTEGSQVLAESLAPRLSDDLELNHAMSLQIAENNPKGLWNVLHALASRPDRRDVIAGLACPFLAIVGAQDKIVALELGKELGSLKADARLCVLPKAGHMPMLEEPMATGALIVSI